MKINSVHRTTYITGIFDPISESRLRWLRQKIKEETGLAIPLYRPHITLMGLYQDPKVVYETITENWSTDPILSLPVEMRKISAYPSLTAISVPISNLNNELRWLQNNLWLTFGIDCSSTQFIPHAWKPHSTLVKNLNTKRKRNDVVTCLGNHWQPWTARLFGLGIMSQGTGKDTYEIQFERGKIS